MSEGKVGPFRFTVPGKPVPWGRARLGVISGHARIFTDKNVRTYQSEVRYIAADAWQQYARETGTLFPPLDGVAITLAVDAFVDVPQSWSQKKTRAAIAGEVRPTGKPDADNYVKSVCDALNAVVFRDDSMIVELIARKWYSDRPRLEVTMEWTAS